MTDQKAIGALPKWKTGSVYTNKGRKKGINITEKEVEFTDNLKSLPKGNCKNVTEKRHKKYNTKDYRLEECSSQPSEDGVDPNGFSIPNQSAENVFFLDKECIIQVKQNFGKKTQGNFKCTLCKYYFFYFGDVQNHTKNNKHKKLLKNFEEKNTIRNLPSQTPHQLESITNLLQSEVKKYGLSQDDLLYRKKIAYDLHILLSQNITGVEVRLYGSSASGYGLKSSDVNLELCVDSEKDASKRLEAAYDIIQKKEEYSHVKCNFSEKIPMIYFTIEESNTKCTINLSNTHSYKTAELLRKYASINEKARVLGIAFRIWAKHCGLDNGDSGMLPAYAFPILVIYFLQQIAVPVLPVLHDLVEKTESKTNPEIYLDPKDLNSIWKSENCMSLGALWLELFHFYALDYDMKDRVVCIQQLIPLHRKDCTRRWSGKKLAIQEPFLARRNVARSMSSTTNLEYFLKCFQKTLKYFGNIQTSSGPIFFNIPKSTCILESKMTEDMKKQDNLIIMKLEKHPFYTEKIIPPEKRRDKISNEFATMSVSKSIANYMFQHFNEEYFCYRLKAELIMGNEKYPIFCTVCQKTGHGKKNCTANDLPEFDICLPPMTSNHLLALEMICEQIVVKYGITEEEIKLRNEAIIEILKFISPVYSKASLTLFGSSCNGFGLKNSDIDICFTFTDSETGKEHDFIKLIEELHITLKSFSKLERLIAITTAKVPILKFCHRDLKVDGDISIYNILGQKNTKLLWTYSEIDPRVKMLGYMIKRFAKVCDMGDASKGSLSSYAYIIMLIYFLQQCDPPVLPVLQELSEVDPIPEEKIDDWNTYFFDDLKRLKYIWPEYGKNKSSSGELWLQLLCFYSAEFKYNDYVISIKQKELLRRFDKLWISKCMAIEDPFDLNHNLGSGLSRSMHAYIVKCFRKGYRHFGIMKTDYVPSVQTIDMFYFKKGIITSDSPPNDRGCRICHKIGHISKECPEKKYKGNKSQKRHVGGFQQGGRKEENFGGRQPVAEELAPQTKGFPKTFNQSKSSMKTNNFFGQVQNPMQGIPLNKGKYNSKTVTRGDYGIMHGAFRCQEKSNVRYGSPRTAKPFGNSLMPRSGILGPSPHSSNISPAGLTIDLNRKKLEAFEKPQIVPE